jgi:hypothetical protein
MAGFAVCPQPGGLTLIAAALSNEIKKANFRAGRIEQELRKKANSGRIRGII